MSAERFSCSVFHKRKMDANVNTEDGDISSGRPGRSRLINDKQGAAGGSLCKETVVTLSIPDPLLVRLAQSSAGTRTRASADYVSESICADLKEMASTAEDPSDSE